MRKTILTIFVEYLFPVVLENQRAWLTRYRTSSHNLRVETGRYTSPVTPLSERICQYCVSGVCDDEEHAILFCDTFVLKRRCFFGRLQSLYPAFSTLEPEQKLSFLLCPPTTQLAKCVSKYLGIISKTRNEIDQGLSIEVLQNYIEHKI